MRFLRKNNAQKIILVISDLHLGAGAFVNGRKNYLEDFHHDKELVSFIQYYQSGPYSTLDVELVINGDFLDFLAVPYVNFFDDEFWSETAAIEKLKLILKAHPEVIDGLEKFLSAKNKKVTYIIGNHDGEFAFPAVREYFLQRFSEKARENLSFCTDHNEYCPVEGVVIKHGHEYEKAHEFDLRNSIIESGKGERYFVPPWGSYYVTRIVNKFKEERDFINQIRPIKSFILHGLIFDTLFTIRFGFANAYYFLMVRFLFIFKQKGKWREIWNYTLEELELWHDFQTLTRDFFFKRPDAHVLIVGHTHEAAFKDYADGTIFINTGSWTKMFNLDFAKKQDGFRLTYAQIDVREKNNKMKNPSRERLDLALNVWSGKSDLPYEEF